MWKDPKRVEKDETLCNPSNLETKNDRNTNKEETTSENKKKDTNPYLSTKHEG